MTGWLFLAAALLVAGAGMAYRRRMARLRSPRLTEDAIRDIEAHGRVQVEEPLDLDEAAREEEEFWDETWDEPERW